MIKVLLVGAGGFLGAVFRYGLGSLITRIAGESQLPAGTLIVNIMGCFLIGILSHAAETAAWFTAEMRLLLLVGLLGAFTTYSTFSNEAYGLFTGQKTGYALLYLALHIVLGLGAVWLGRLSSVGLLRLAQA